MMGWELLDLKNKQKIPHYLSVENNISVYLNIIVLFLLYL